MNARVLVVDDSPTIRRVVGAMLARAGYDVGGAGDGALALVALRRERFDLALVDFVMPRLNGFELCRKLREDAELRDLPVVLMSAKADRIRENFMRQTGALDAIAKPFDPRTLLDTVEAVLRRVEEGRARREHARHPEHARDRGPGGRSMGETLEAPVDGAVGSAPPPSGAPTDFVRRLAHAYARISRPSDVPATERELEGELSEIAASLRHRLGDAGLGSLYSDLVGASARAALSGDLGAIPLAEVLQLLQLQRQTGLLTIFTPQTEVQIALREGLIDLAMARGADEEFRIGRYLTEPDHVDAGLLDALVEQERARARPRLLGEALVAEGVVAPEAVHAALVRQTSELVYDVLRWTRGRFVFDQKGARLEANAAQLGLVVASIVMEGFRRVDEWRLIDEVLGDVDRVFQRDPGAVEAMGTARLTREERVVLMAIDGQRSLREVIATVRMGSFDGCKIVFQLVQSRLVRPRDT